MDHGIPGSVCPCPFDHATSTNFTNQDLRASEVDLVVKMSGVLRYLRVGNEHMSTRTTEGQHACLAHIAVSTHRLCIEHVSTRTKKAKTQPLSTSPITRERKRANTTPAWRSSGLYCAGKASRIRAVSLNVVFKPRDRRVQSEVTTLTAWQTRPRTLSEISPELLCSVRAEENRREEKRRNTPNERREENQEYVTGNQAAQYGNTRPQAGGKSRPRTRNRRSPGRTRGHRQC